MTLDATPLFLDTAYVNALVNTRDQWHPAAARGQTRVVRGGQRIVTTEFVLTEIGTDSRRLGSVLRRWV